MRKILFFILLLWQKQTFAQLIQHELVDEMAYNDAWQILPIDWQDDGVLDFITFQFEMYSQMENIVLYTNDGNSNVSFNRVLSRLFDPYWSYEIQRLTHVDIDNDGVWEVLAESSNELYRLDYELPNAQPYLLMGTPTVAWYDPIQLYPVSPWLIDFDEDGDLDIAALSSGSNVWLINDNGFDEYITEPRTGDYYWPSEDWNGDGLGDYYIDTPSQSPGMYDLTCYLQQTNGSFDGPGNGSVVYQFPADDISTFTFEDLNADGLNDLLIRTNLQVRSALKQANGSFGSLQTLYNFPGSQYEQLFSDFDNDGDKDIIMISNVYFPITDYVVLNNGDGTFGPLTAIEETRLANTLIANLDGVGGMDLVGVNDARSPFAQLTLQFQFEDDYNGSIQSLGVRLGFLFGENYDYHVSDLDQDGEMDIYRSATYFPHGGAVIKSAYTDHPSFHPVEHDDYSYFLVDRDPMVENEVMAYYWQGNNFMVNYGVLDITTYTINLISETTVGNNSGFLTSPKSLDLNNDGDMDLLLEHSGFLSTYGAPIILLSNGDGSFEVMSLPLIAGESVLFAGCFDLNNDSQYEYYLADDQRTYRMVYDGMGNWSQPEVVFDLPILLKHLVDDEVNGQQYIIAAVYATNASLDYYLTLLPDGTLQDMRSLRDPSFPYGPGIFNACFDIDGDGFDELVSSEWFGSTFWITNFQNGEASGQTYSVQQRALYGSSQSNYNVADINGDGALDMYVADNPLFEWIENTVPLGCTDPLACNYTETAIHSADLCCYSSCGCADALACNYDSNATCDNGTCVAHGCTNPEACNFDPTVTCDDGSCILDAMNLTCVISSDDIEITQTIFSISFQSQAGSTEPTYISLFDLGNDELITEFHCIPDDCYRLSLAPIAGYIDSAQVDFYIFRPSGEVVIEESNTMQGFAELTWWSNDGLIFCICGDDEVAGCTDPEAANYNVQATCESGSCAYTMHGRVYNDVNANGVFDAGDYGLPFQQVVINPDNMLVYTDDQGYYSINVGQGNFVIAHVADDVFPYYSTSPSYMGLSQELFADGLDFGISATVPVANICLDIYPDWYLCDEWVNFNLCFRNLGNLPVSGVLAFTYDDLMQGHNAITPIDSVVGNTVYFSYENLLPGHMFFYNIQVHTPTFEWMGEMVTFSCAIEGYYNDALAATGYKTLIMEHACSYDPNDKNGYPLGYTESHFVEDGTAIEYVVRFQNTGNAPALNVRIEDAIDPNIDLSTFELVANSHSVMTVLDEDARRVFFYFNNIMLPDSATDEPASNGLVSYRVSLAEPLPTGTEIHNTASIYFDNNPAVVTNTTLHTIYNCEDFAIDILVDESEWCSAQTVEMNAVVPWADAYMWLVNGQLASQTTELQVFEAGEKQITFMADNPLCGLFEESLTLNLYDVQTQSITASATSICEGESVELAATYTGNTYAWSINGELLSTDAGIEVTTSGAYELTTTMGACVQSNTIDISVTPLPEVNITQSINVLSTLANANWTYQWYFNDELIIGATASTYEITASGMYQVVVMNGSCEQSSEINATYLGVEENGDASWSWYPNPVLDELTLTCATDQIDQELEVVDVMGRVVYAIRITQAQLHMDTSNWSSGAYTLRMKNGTTIGQVLKN